MSEWLPLTAAQRGLFFGHQLAPENPCYTTAEVVELTGPVDDQRLAVAIEQTYGEFEQLRTVFRVTPEGPQQRVTDETARLQVVSLESPAAAEEWVRRDLAGPMDLLAGSPAAVVRTALLRLPGDVTWWYHAAHHVVLDGYGAHQLISRVAQRYADPEAPPTNTPTLAEVVSDAIDGEESDQGRLWWQEQLKSFAGVVSLSGRVGTAASTARRVTVELGERQQQVLVDGARRLEVTWPDLATAAVGAYLARMAGRPNTRIGVPLMNRTVPGRGALPTARTVCSAVNVQPIVVPATGMVADALAQTVAGQRALRDFPRTRHEELARMLQRQDPSVQLFGAQLNLVPFDLSISLEGPSGTAQGTVRNLRAGPVEDLTVCLRGTPGRRRTVRLELDANPELYDAAELELHAHRLAAWFEAYASAEPAAQVTELRLLTEQERHQVLAGFNDTTHPHEAQTLGERFVAQVRRSPDAVALRFRGEQRSYCQLHEGARRVAAGLTVKGVGTGDVVGVALPRGFELYEVLHGIQLAGAVYLPLDPDLPAARIEAMTDDARAALVVTPAEIPDADPQYVPADECQASTVHDPAYLLFTSGSTGRPKGVLVGHAAIDNRLAWMQDHLPLAVGDRVLHKTPISFDVSIWELFWPLQVGATVVIAEPGTHRDPRALAETIVAERVSTLHFVPSMLRAFLADATAREQVASGVVRTVVTSGEALTPDLVAGTATWFGVPPTNLYGPTEAAVDVTCWDCLPGEATVPIGRPIRNTRCYVLDDRRRPLPIGVVGELWLAGVQLAEGYVGRPDLTAERFVDVSFDGSGTTHRMYRTGDLAAWRADGALRYVGRTDDQVKVRGQRIELGEIEAVATGVPAVQGVAAGMVEDRLVVWFVPVPGGADKAERALREAVAASLPSSWTPHHWVAVSEIPVGSSGKTDRRRLAEIAPPQVLVDDTTSPRGLVEQRLCEIVGDVLDVAVVGPQSDFFAIGGDSLRALRLLGEIEADLGVRLDLADVFATPTAAGLAEAAGADRAETSGTDEVLTLRPGSKRTPLFLLPPAGGLGWCYSGLLRSLPSDQPVYTIQAPGLTDGRPAPVDDLEMLAERQLAAIRTVVGDGPFHLAGWSLGGMAAQSVAHRARESGLPVGRVVLLDAYPADQWHHLEEPTEAEALAGLLRLGGVVPPAGEELNRERAVALLRAGSSAIAELPEPVLNGCLASVIEAARLIRRSSHGVFDGDLTVVVATAPRPEEWLDPAGWRAYATGDVRCVDIDVSHGEMMRRPAVDRIGAVLAELIDAP